MARCRLSDCSKTTWHIVYLFSGFGELLHFLKIFRFLGNRRIDYCMLCWSKNIDVCYRLTGSFDIQRVLTTGDSENMAESRPRQNFHQESEAGINKQINMELYASYVYQSMVIYFLLLSFVKFSLDMFWSRALLINE